MRSRSGLNKSSSKTKSSKNQSNRVWNAANSGRTGSGTGSVQTEDTTTTSSTAGVTSNSATGSTGTPTTTNTKTYGSTTVNQPIDSLPTATGTAGDASSTSGLASSPARFASGMMTSNNSNDFRDDTRVPLLVQPIPNPSRGGGTNNNNAGRYGVPGSTGCDGTANSANATGAGGVLNMPSVVDSYVQYQQQAGITPLTQAAAGVLAGGVSGVVIAGAGAVANKAGGAAGPGAGASASAAAAAAAAAANRVRKVQRPRKALAEFRKKGRHSRTGRIGVHTIVDEIDIEKLADGRLLEALQESVRMKKEGIEKEKEKGSNENTVSHIDTSGEWNVVDYFDAIRVWKTVPDLYSQQQNNPYNPMGGLMSGTDMPFSEDDGDASATERPSHYHQHSLTGGNGGDGIGAGGEGDPDMIWEVDTSTREVYIFSFGTFVFWNFPSIESEDEWARTFVFDKFPNCYGKHLTKEERDSAADEAAFWYGSKFSLKRDVVTLVTRDSGEKLAVSFAMGKSSLLTVYEERVQQTIARNSHIPEEMAKNGRLHMTRQEISKEVGHMLIVKHGINLDQSLIDTPEEFWEDDRYENRYDMTLKYFEISKRLELVNQRLDMIGELHQVLIEENQNHHAVILEWIIIILIIVEVMLDMLHLGFY